MDPIVSKQLSHKDYTALVYPYAFGQFRIQLCNRQVKDDYGKGVGAIVREMCTYSFMTMTQVVDALSIAIDPEQTAESYATKSNCENKGGRIRLDQ